MDEVLPRPVPPDFSRPPLADAPAALPAVPVLTNVRDFITNLWQNLRS